MGRLIADVHEHITTRYAREYQLRKTLKENLDKTPKGSRARFIIGKQLEKVRATLAKCANCGE